MTKIDDAINSLDKTLPNWEYKYLERRDHGKWIFIEDIAPAIKKAIAEEIKPLRDKIINDNFDHEHTEECKICFIIDELEKILIELCGEGY